MAFEKQIFEDDKDNAHAFIQDTLNGLTSEAYATEERREWWDDWTFRAYRTIFSDPVATRVIALKWIRQVEQEARVIQSEDMPEIRQELGHLATEEEVALAA